jgi:hypothetical protein
LQTDVALSTTEAEYNAMSASLREVIHLMQVVEEAKQLDWKIFQGIPTVHCKVFEDNIGALEMARLPKMRPRTKHLCVRMHHFRERVRKKQITIQHVASELQMADLLTKPQPESLFVVQREMLLRWKKETKSPAGTANANLLRACDIPEERVSVSKIPDSLFHADTSADSVQIVHRSPAGNIHPNSEDAKAQGSGLDEAISGITGHQDQVELIDAATAMEESKWTVIPSKIKRPNDRKG